MEIVILILLPLLILMKLGDINTNLLNIKNRLDALECDVNSLIQGDTTQSPMDIPPIEEKTPPTEVPGRQGEGLWFSGRCERAVYRGRDKGVGNARTQQEAEEVYLDDGVETDLHDLGSIQQQKPREKYGQVDISI